MSIEVTWETKPKSGITNIELSDLGCKDIKEWDSLSKKTQVKRINDALEEYDGGNLKAIATEWYTTGDD